MVYVFTQCAFNLRLTFHGKLVRNIRYCHGFVKHSYTIVRLQGDFYGTHGDGDSNEFRQHTWIQFEVKGSADSYIIDLTGPQYDIYARYSDVFVNIVPSSDSRYCSMIDDPQPHVGVLYEYCKAFGSWIPPVPEQVRRIYAQLMKDLHRRQPRAPPGERQMGLTWPDLCFANGIQPRHLLWNYTYCDVTEVIYCVCWNLRREGKDPPEPQAVMEEFAKLSPLGVEAFKTVSCAMFIKACERAGEKELALRLRDKVPISFERLDMLRADALYTSSWWTDLLNMFGIRAPDDVMSPPPFRLSETTYDPL